MVSFTIEGNDYKELEKFHKKHKNCLKKHPNISSAQYSYTFIEDSFGTLKSCKCVCGKTITLSADYDLAIDKEKECKLKVEPEDAKTERIVRILQSMQVRPGLYFGKERSYKLLNYFLTGFAAGVTAQGEEECYWSKDLQYEVDAEFRKMTEGKNYSDEDLFYKFFEAFDLVIARDYPQYLLKSN